MSFSYGSIPPPDSPPLKATPLSPAPARSTDRRAKRHTHTALSPSALNGIGALSLSDPLHDDPLDLDGNSSSLHQLASTLSRENTNKRASSMAIPVPKMISPLPPHYRHPSPAPSTVPSLTASSTHESSTASSASSACSVASTRSSRRSIVPKPSLTSIHIQDTSSNETSSSDSLPCEPLTPTGATFSRSRGKSISRAVGKLASDLLSLNKKKDRSDSDGIPPVPALPTLGNCRK